MPRYDVEFQLMVNGRAAVNAANMEAAEKRIRNMSVTDLVEQSYEMETEYESVEVDHANF